MRYLFILGKHPGLSKLELFSLLDSLSYKHSLRQESKDFIVLDIQNFNADRFIKKSSAIIKIAEKLRIEEYVYTREGRKVNFGISFLGKVDPSFAENISSELKDIYKQEKVKASLKHPSAGHSGRELFMPAEISAKHLEDFILLNKEVFKTIACSSPFDYKKRDEQRPEKDFKMQTSIRLARILINLSQAKKSILDPYCGYGTILQEAMLSDLDVIGFEINKNTASSCIKNLEWIAKKYNLKTRFNIYNKPNPDIPKIVKKYSVDAIVTEPDMGPYFKIQPQRSQALQLFKRLENDYKNLFSAVRCLLKPDSLIIFMLPVLNFRGGRIAIEPDKILNQNFEVLPSKYSIKLPVLLKGKVFDRLIYILKPKS